MERASALDVAATQARTRAARPHDADRWLGRIVDGRYKVLDVIGRGGMGVVYRVEHIRLAKIAAMKVIHPDLLSNADAAARFEREALTATKLTHPNTVQIFDFGTFEGATYLIMEFVRGLDLASHAQQGPMPWTRVGPIAVQVLAALDEAHTAGIVHRDIKPENVLLSATSSARELVKVLDFGLAKVMEAPVSGETEREQIMGTPYYMAPEQIRGDRVDARTDLYALGCMIYFLLSGRHPYEASTPLGVLTQHLTSDVPRLESMRDVFVPAGIGALCARAMAKEPSDRYPTARDFAAAIEGLLEDVSRPWLERVRTDVSDDESQRLQRADLDAFERGLRRRRIAFGVGTALCGAAVLAGGAYLLLRRPPLATVEREPNHELALATRAPLGKAITGYIGKRLSPTEPDRDVYRFVAPARQPVTTVVTGLPNIDIGLRLYRASGQALAEIDEAGVGDGERLMRRMVEGEFYVEVVQVQAARPVENVSDAYALTVFVDEAPEWEVEPNETSSDATSLAPGEPVHGSLDARRDADWLRFTGPRGNYELHITASTAVQWQLDGRPGTLGKTMVELGPGSMLRLWRADADAAKSASVPADWRVVVTQR